MHSRFLIFCVLWFTFTSNAFGAPSAQGVVQVEVDGQCQWQWPQAEGPPVSGADLFLTPILSPCAEQEGVCEYVIMPTDLEPPELGLSSPEVQVAAGVVIDVFEACGVSWSDNCGAPAEVGVHVSAAPGVDGVSLTTGEPGTVHTITFVATDPALNQSQMTCALTVE
ncbi:MAG: hypothetical protein ACE366_00520 [Bradymonadia bacterium]